MALTVKHNKVSAIPDDPAAVAAGEVVPSDWNDNHPVTGTLDVANGGTGATSLTGYVKGNGTGAMSASATVPGSDVSGNISGNAANVTGTVAVANGGTGQTTANAALNALLPSQSSQSGKFLTTDGTDTSWATAGGGGSSPLTIQNKTGAYTVVAGDLGTIINCTSGTFTVSLTAAATLGAGFNFWVWNTGTGTITIDPNGSETIDGISTLILRQGEGTQIICDGTNWQTGDKKTMRGYAENIASNRNRPIASGNAATAIGEYSVASGNSSTAFTGSTASGQYSLALLGSASSSGSSAIGCNSGLLLAQAVTGSGAMALGGSRASGIDSFAAAVANNTSTYGATGANSVAIGVLNQSQSNSSVAIGNLSTASATSSVAIGEACKASAFQTVALGASAKSSTIGKYSYASGDFGSSIDICQSAKYVLRRATTDATATVLTTDNSAPGTNDQVILPNNSAYAFTGTIIARQQAAGGTASAAWKIEGLIRREGSAGTTTLVASTVTAIDNTPGWTLALSADTTNGGLKIEATGAAATNIRWVATVQTSEVTYA